MVRYGIFTRGRVIGVRVAGIQELAKQLGRDTVWPPRSGTPASSGTLRKAFNKPAK